MRKEAGFEVMDKIILYASGNKKIEETLSDRRDEICKEVLANDIVLTETKGYVKEWNINDEKVTMGVEKDSAE